MSREELARIDGNHALREKLIPYCRLAPGEIWSDPLGRHRVGAGSACDSTFLDRLFTGQKADLFVQDPPYNFEVGGKQSNALSRIDIDQYISFSREWVQNCLRYMADPAYLYVWLGADQRREFQPLPDFMILMREFHDLHSKSFITLRNQRGYGTKANWMSVRQELLCYTKGEEQFQVQYTEIPKILRGYYKTVDGKRTENSERGGSDTLRASNVWVDIQQVFYRREENVPGTYAQKPLAAIERIIASSSSKEALVADFFSHSGTTLLAAERLGRRCFCLDLDPIFAELSIRRLERFRESGKSGWQWRTPFPELLP